VTISDYLSLLKTDIQHALEAMPRYIEGRSRIVAVAAYIWHGDEAVRP